MIPLSTTSSKNPGNIKINKASEIFERVKKLEIQGVNVINFAFGTPRVEMPQLIRNAAYEALRSSQSLMVPIEGLPELRRGMQ